jgi:hypothetical protein
LGSGFCCVCGQPACGFGWHVWDEGTNENASWHCACVIAWQFWNAPSGQVRLLRRLQARRCGQTGGRLWKSAQVDHRVPLFRVWSQYPNAPRPELLAYWGLPNLQMINRDVYAAKSATEARDRRAARKPTVRRKRAASREQADLPAEPQKLSITSDLQNAK